MINKNFNTILILAIVCMFQTIQEMFCNDDTKREQAIREFKTQKVKLIRCLDYTLGQAMTFHQLTLKKGGTTHGNSNIVSLAAQKRSAG